MRIQKKGKPMKKNNKELKNAYDTYQSDKINNFFRITPSKETQKKLKTYSKIKSFGKNNLLDMAFSLFS